MCCCPRPCRLVVADVGWADRLLWREGPVHLCDGQQHRSCVAVVLPQVSHTRPLSDEVRVVRVCVVCVCVCVECAQQQQPAGWWWCGGGGGGLLVQSAFVGRPALMCMVLERVSRSSRCSRTVRQRPAASARTVHGVFCSRRRRSWRPRLGKHMMRRAPLGVRCIFLYGMENQ